MPIQTGDVVAGRYRVEALVGQGGMARVWRARDGSLDRQVALKEILLPPETQQGVLEREFKRLRLEAQVLARLDHPGVVSVHDVVQHDGVPVIVMQLSYLESLRSHLDRGATWGARDAAQLGLQVLQALRHAHERGVVHRDVKPDNILYTPGPPMKALVTDFGIAKVDGGTTTTALVGTPAYLAPEQWEGRSARPESDLWALGVLLFEMIEGRRPFDGPHPAAVMRAVLHDPVPEAPHAAGLTPVLRGLLVKDPGARMPAADAQKALEAVALGASPLPAAACEPERATSPSEQTTVLVEPGKEGATKVLPEQQPAPEAAVAEAFWRVGKGVANSFCSLASMSLVFACWRLSWFHASGKGGYVYLGVLPLDDRRFSPAALAGALIVLGAAWLVRVEGDASSFREWRACGGVLLAVLGVFVAAGGQLQAQHAAGVDNSAVQGMPGMWLCIGAAGAVLLAAAAAFLARRAALTALSR